MFSEANMPITVLILILVIQTTAILVIAYFVYRSSKRVSRTLDEMSDAMASLRPDVEDTVESARNSMSSLQETSVHINNIANEINDLFDKFQETTEDVFGVFEDAAVRAEHHVSRVDHLFTEAIDRTAESTEYVTRTVYPQIMELAALAKGVCTTIEYLKKKRRFPIASFTRR